MTSGLSIEGWRLRRRQAVARSRPLRVAVTGRAPVADETAWQLAGAGVAEVILSAESSNGAASAALDMGGRVRHVVHLEHAAPVDVLVVCEADESRVRDAALWAARTCPDTAVVIAARDGLALCRAASRASGLNPHLIVAPGGIPRAVVERGRIARALGVSALQAEVPIVGGDGYAATRPLWRYATAAGIPIDALTGARDPAAMSPPGGEVTDGLLAASAAVLARAILLDRRLVLCCAGWVEGAFGVPDGWVTAPFRVGARGVEEPLPLRLTIEERALLMRASA